MAELKPCPFCGGEAQSSHGVTIAFVRCRKCPAEMCVMEEDLYDHEYVNIDELEKVALEKVTAAWNRRAGDGKWSTNAKIV